MEVKELRIGNLVRSCYSELGIMSITAISEDILKSDKIEKIWVKSLIGIELTEEWLLKLGFKKDTEYGYFVKEIKQSKEFILDFSTQLNSWFLCDTDVDTDIKHVHQLQNLYFALTGEELTIK